VRGFFGAFGSLGFGLKLLRDLGVAAAAAARTSASYLRATSAQWSTRPRRCRTRQQSGHTQSNMYIQTWGNTTRRSGSAEC